MYRKENPHRFLTVAPLREGSFRPLPERGTTMLDVLMLAIAAGLFALTIGYAVACDRL
jgi:hypothetical protein